jgi:cytochrome c
MNKIFSAACIAGLAAGLAVAQENNKSGDAAKGKELFEQCGACHVTDTDEKKVGPSLKGLYKKDKLANGSKVTDASVKKVINEGGNGMPAYADMLSDEEKNHVLAYLKTL